MIHERNEVGGTSESSTVGADPNSRIASSKLRFISKAQLAEALGVSTRTIDTWMSQKRIPYLRLSPRLIKFELHRVLQALGRYEVREVGGRR
jgi:predicted DNA-binding transcriptional regulator AlpA